MIYIQNPPSDMVLKDSLEVILQKAFSYDTKDQIYLYLVEDMSSVKLLDRILKQFSSNNSKVIVNTLSLPIAMELRRQQDWLEGRGVQLLLLPSD